jgi:SRSO17 transposase
MVAACWPRGEVGETGEQGDAAEAAVLAEGAATWERLHERLAHRFSRAEVRARVRRVLAGLLSRVERKNGWQLAETIEEHGPQGVQRLLTGAVWDVEAVRDDLRAYVIEHLRDQDGVLIIDETGFPKKGTHSCGVAGQYTGAAGRCENAQVGVFLAYAAARGTAFLDRALYLPRAWVNDRVRCTAAGVPTTVRFATKVALATQLLARAFAAHVPAHWVVADCLYGRVHHFRRWLERQGRAYVVGVIPAQSVRAAGRQQRAQALAASLPATAWQRQSAGPGVQGERRHNWACVPLEEDTPRGMGRWLLVRRSLVDPGECAYFRAYGPADTPPAHLVRVAGTRWAVEEAFAQAKGEVGLDQYEVRQWEAWHRHITLCLLAHAFLVIVLAQARDATRAAGQKGGLLLPAS